MLINKLIQGEVQRFNHGMERFSRQSEYNMQKRQHAEAGDGANAAQESIISDAIAKRERRAWKRRQFELTA